MSITVLGNVGVTVETAAIRTGSLSPALAAYASLTSTTAAAPSEVAQMSSRCSGSRDHGAGEHVLDASTSLR